MYYIKDEQKRRIDIYFDAKPADNIIEFIKNDGWKWNRNKGCWFTYISPENIKTAELLGAVPYKPEGEMRIERFKDNNDKLYRLTSSKPILNKLYSAYSVSDIRMIPSGVKELESDGVSASDIFEYLKLVYMLYETIIHGDKNAATIGLSWIGVVEFCKKHRLIYKDFDERINIEHLTDCVSFGFEQFRLQVERFLTETNPETQLIKVVYGVDVVDCEWWREWWLPTMCKLGHRRNSGNELQRLSRNELLTLMYRMTEDCRNGKYPNILTDMFEWGQIIYWHLEELEAPTEVEDNTLYIHKGRIICQTRNHDVIQATAILVNRIGKDVKLNVNYCRECKKFFLSYSVYLRYREMYGMILGDLKMLKTEDFNTLEPCLAEESPLHLCGYTVAERVGLLAEERQGVIAFVINRGIMGKEEVVSHLAWLIDTNEHRENMDRAIMKWKEDLDYALAYYVEGQAKYIISQLERYRPNQFEVHQ